MNHLDPRFTRTEYVVEASRFEYLALHEMYHLRRGISWEQDISGGPAITVGTLDNRPVNIACCWAIIDDLPVMFYESTSQVVDHAMIEVWLDQHCCPMDGVRKARTDAMNFHHVLYAARDKKFNRKQECV